MAIEQDSTFGYSAQLAQFQFLQNQRVELENLRNRQKFEQQLLTWKSKVLFEKDPTIPRPEVPLMKTIDPEKIVEEFNLWYFNTERVEQTHNYEIGVPLPLTEKDWELTPKNEIDPNQDPVYGPDDFREGWFLVSPGESSPLNHVIDHPKYGKLKKIGKVTPFTSWYRWEKVTS